MPPRIARFYVHSGERANIGCTAIIITCFIGRANEFPTSRTTHHAGAHPAWTTHAIHAIGARCFDRNIMRALLRSRRAARPMTRICMYTSNTEPETDGKSLLRAPAPFRRLSVPLPPSLPQTRHLRKIVIATINRADVEFGANEMFFFSFFLSFPCVCVFF